MVNLRIDEKGLDPPLFEAFTRQKYFAKLLSEKTCSAVSAMKLESLLIVVKVESCDNCRRYDAAPATRYHAKRILIAWPVALSAGTASSGELGGATAVVYDQTVENGLVPAIFLALTCQ